MVRNTCIRPKRGVSGVISCDGRNGRRVVKGEEECVVSSVLGLGGRFRCGFGGLKVSAYQIAMAGNTDASSAVIMHGTCHSHVEQAQREQGLL